MSRENQPDQFGENSGPSHPAGIIGATAMDTGAMGLFMENSEPTAGSTRTVRMNKW